MRKSSLLLFLLCFAQYFYSQDGVIGEYHGAYLDNYQTQGTYKDTVYSLYYAKNVETDQMTKGVPWEIPIYDEIGKWETIATDQYEIEIGQDALRIDFVNQLRDGGRDANYTDFHLYWADVEDIVGKNIFDYGGDNLTGEIYAYDGKPINIWVQAKADKRLNLRVDLKDGNGRLSNRISPRTTIEVGDYNWFMFSFSDTSMSDGPDVNAVGEFADAWSGDWAGVSNGRYVGGPPMYSRVGSDHAILLDPDLITGISLYIDDGYQGDKGDEKTLWIKTIQLGGDAPGILRPTDLTLESSDLHLSVGESASIISSITGDDLTSAYDQSVVYTVSGSAVEVIDETAGEIVAISDGVSVVTVQSVAYPSLKATCTVTVANVPVEDISLLSSVDLNLQIGELSQILYALVPDDSNDDIQFEVTSGSAVTVNETGLVKAVASGSAEITVYSKANPFKVNEKIMVSVNAVTETVTVKETISDFSITIDELAERFSFDDLFEVASGNELRFSVVSSDQTVARVEVDDEGFSLVQLGQGTAMITVSAQTANSLPVSQSFTVTVEASSPTECIPLSVSSSIVNNNCYGEKKGSVVLSVTGGSAPYSYSWSTGRSDNLIANKPAGRYWVVITDANFCSEYKEFTITEPSQLTASVVTTNPECEYSNGAVSVTISGGTSAYTIQWDNGDKTNSLDGLSAGVYTATVTDSKGCRLVKSTELNNTSAPVIALESTADAKCSEASGAIDISVAGGSAPYTYKWSDGVNTADRSGLATGEYALTVTDQNGCKSAFIQHVANEAVQANPICVVTVSPKTGKNHVVWTKVQSAEMVKQYNIYCEKTQAGVYELIGTVPYDSLSVYEDLDADPTVRSWRYKISAVDHCGNESELSDGHKTINLRKSKGINGEVNLEWDYAEGISIPSYKIYRRSKTAGTEEIAVLPSSLNWYIDKAPPADLINYYIGVDLKGQCRGMKSDSGPFGQSVSNLSEAELVATKETEFGVKVYPQPAEDKLTIAPVFEDTYTVEVYTPDSKLVLRQQLCGKSEVNVAQLQTGFYILKIVTANNAETQSISIK